MKRPTLLYASPLPPDRSGIAAYSEALLQGLCSRLDITLLSRARRTSLRGAGGRRPVVRHGVDPVEPGRFDHVLYNIGNHPGFHSFIYETFLEHPGPVILHDVVLYFLVVGHHQDRGDLFSKVYELAGADGVRILREELRGGRHLLHYPAPERLPLNDEVLGRAPLILVHSRFARQAIRRRHPGANVRLLPMVDPASARLPLPGEEIDVAARLGVPAGAPIIASFGIIAPTKQNRLVCRAVSRIRAEPGCDPVYVMVGEGDDADGFLGPRVIKTGFVDAGTYDALLARADLVVNLRHPTMGETSLSQLQAMSRGKATVVTDEAWFSELPGDTVVRVGHDVADSELAGTLAGLLRDRERLAAVGSSARDYVRAHHDVESVSDRLVAMLEDPVNDS